MLCGHVSSSVLIPVPRCLKINESFTRGCLNRYFAPPEAADALKGSTLRAAKFGLGPSFGTLSLGALVLTLIELARQALQQYVPSMPLQQSRAFKDQSSMYEQARSRRQPLRMHDHIWAMSWLCLLRCEKPVLESRVRRHCCPDASFPSAACVADRAGQE